MSNPQRRTRRRRKWVFILLTLLMVWVAVMQFGCLTMRTADDRWSEKMRKAGQSATLRFHDIPAPEINRTIHAVELSTADSLPVLMMVHGSPGAADAYLSFFADTVLSANFHMMALDRPGFGFTSSFGVAEGSLDRQAKAVLAVLNQLAPGQKAILFGHSMGGPIIARFAMDYPERTAGLMFAAASIDPALEAQPWWQLLVDAPPVRWLLPKVMVTSNKEIMPLRDELEAMMPFWDSITCPVTVLHAVDDRLVPIGNAHFAKKMCVNSSNVAMHILPEGDHFIIWSRPDLMQKTIMEIQETLEK